MINQARLPLTLRDKDIILYEWLRPGGYLEGLLGANAIQFRDEESGMAFLELIAGMSDVHGLVMDRDIQETNILTAREIQNVFELAASRGYFARLATGATIPVRLRFTNYVGYLPLARGSQFGSNTDDGEQVIFEIETDVAKPAGPNYIDLTLVQGESVTEEDVTSNGNIRDRISLSEGPVIHDSAVVIVDGVKWSRVDTFLQSDASSQHFRIISSELIPGEREYFVQFGNNEFGKYPDVGSIIQISWRRGGGKVGNIPAEILTDVLFDLVAPDGTSVNVEVEALADGSGGYDEESIDEIRINSYTEQITNSRSVTLQDYALAARVAGAAKRALALTYNQNPLLQINTVYVVTCVDLITPPTQSQRDAIKTAIQSQYPQGDAARLLIIPCSFKAFTAHVEVRLRNGATLADLYDEIENIVSYMLSIDGMVGVAGGAPRFVLDFDQALHPNVIEKEVAKLNDVLYCRIKLDGADEPITPGLYEMLQPGTITYDIQVESS